MRKSSHAISGQGNEACGNGDNFQEACQASHYPLAVAIHKKCQLKKKRIKKIITDNGCFSLRTGNTRDSSHALSKHDNNACGNNENSQQACHKSHSPLSVAIHKRCQFKKSSYKIRQNPRTVKIQHRWIFDRKTPRYYQKQVSKRKSITVVVLTNAIILTPHPTHAHARCVADHENKEVMANRTHKSKKKSPRGFFSLCIFHPELATKINKEKKTLWVKNELQLVFVIKKF